MECQLDSNIVTKRKKGYLSCNKHFKVLQNKKFFFSLLWKFPHAGYLKLNNDNDRKGDYLINT